MAEKRNESVMFLDIRTGISITQLSITTKVLSNTTHTRYLGVAKYALPYISHISINV